VIPREVAKVTAVRKQAGAEVLGQVTVDQAYGGMRAIPGLIYETSLLDPEEGIRFRGYTIPELQDRLPSAGDEPSPEGLIWLLMTGEIPTADQVTKLSEEMAARAKLPTHVVSMIEAFPKGMHPMTQLSASILGCQTESKFAKFYADGGNKKLYWESTYEDSMDLMSMLPEIAGLIYQHTFHEGKCPTYDASKDVGANFANFLGIDTPAFADLMRLYLVIHSDHEGGNGSAHTSHLVGSMLSDPYLATAASMNALAGPLHGLANQEVLRWLKRDILEPLGGEEPTKENMTALVQATLDRGNVVPGYGHAVLRKTDPRYTCQREYALKHLPDDHMFKVVSMLYDVVPPVLTKLGKVKNPWPNVDSHSGVLLQHYGLVEEDFYTCMFGVGRAMGVLPQQVWSRVLGFPLERPKSFTTDSLAKKFDVKL